jgi:hypothetical protein
MNTSIKNDDVIFNFFKQICDEKDDVKCLELGKDWIQAMETNLSNMETNLNGADKLKHKNDIQSNRNHLSGLKDKSSSEWREYATQCMIEIINQKTNNRE